MEGWDYEMIANLLFGAAAGFWILSVLLWFALRLPEEISEVWQIMRGRGR